MLLNLGDASAAAPHFSRAYRAYSAWGALAKTRQMRRRVGHLLTASDAATDLSPVDARGDDELALTALDVKSVLKVARGDRGRDRARGPAADAADDCD